MAHTQTTITSGPNTNIEKISIPWTANGGGAYTESIVLPPGWIVEVEFAPGSPAPTDQYDVTLPDATTAWDALCGVGANALTATTTRKCPGITITDGTNSVPVPPFVHGTYTFTIANAGNGGVGTTNIWIRK